VVVPTYDFDGNLTKDGLWTYTWDAENRLSSMAMDGNAG
jgi:YD repeat-containing protein